MLEDGLVEEVVVDGLVLVDGLIEVLLVRVLAAVLLMAVTDAHS